MKKLLRMAFSLTLALLLLCPMEASANMAAPLNPDVGSSITFQRNDALAVTEEVLDITVTGSTARISAAYSMVNTTDEPVSTPVMFLSPNTGDGSVEVTADGESVSCSIDRYALHYDTQVETEDWRYAVLSDEAEADSGGQTVDAISFQLDFAPGEAYEVRVSYPYRLGGYPDYDFDAKRGEIFYYLAPAALWRDFQSLTINLYLDEDMPVVTQSSLDFEKVGPRTYRYHSDTLPEGNLEITIDENWFQNIFSTLRSPYLGMLLFPVLILLCPILLLVVAIVLVVRFRRRRRAKKRQNNGP